MGSISLHNYAGAFGHKQAGAHTIQGALLILESRIHSNTFKQCSEYL